MPQPRAALNVIFEFNMAGARLGLVGFYLNVHSVTGNVGETRLSVEFWR